MIKAQYFASVAEVVADLRPESGGDEQSILKSIRFASEFIANNPKLGQFIPSLETKRFDGNGKDEIHIPPILDVTSITVDGDAYATTDYILYPRNRHWENGPYSRIIHDPDGEYRLWDELVDSLVIVGKWGKYDLSEDTGATVQNNPQAIGDKNLVTDDGSKVSPGMVLLIGTEQEFVTGTKKESISAAVTTVSVAIDQIDQEITLTDATKVKVGEIVRVDLEDMKIMAINATTKKAAVKRAYNNTAAAAHVITSAVDVYRTFNVERGVNGTTAAAHAKDTVISRYIAPTQINTLCKQIACNIQNLGESGYTGKSANTQQGQELFYWAFPRDADLEKYETQFNLWE